MDGAAAASLIPCETCGAVTDPCPIRAYSTEVAMDDLERSLDPEKRHSVVFSNNTQ